MLDEMRYIIRGDDLVINKNLIVHNPTVRELIEYGEKNYDADVNAITLRPYDACVMLDQMGINYQEIQDYDLFVATIRGTLPHESVLLPGINFSEMEIGIHPDNGRRILYNPKTSFIFDELMYAQLVEYVRGIHFIRYAVEFDAGNEATRKILIKRMKRAEERRKRTPTTSQYAPIISSLVNNPNFKYDYASVMDIKVSQLWDAFYHINKFQSYQHTMLGIYTGNIDASKIDKDALTWFGRIDINENKMDKSKAIATTR